MSLRCKCCFIHADSMWFVLRFYIKQKSFITNNKGFKVAISVSNQNVVNNTNKYIVYQKTKIISNKYNFS